MSESELDISFPHEGANVDVLYENSANALVHLPRSLVGGDRDAPLCGAERRPLSRVARSQAPGQASNCPLCSVAAVSGGEPPEQCPQCAASLEGVHLLDHVTQRRCPEGR